MGLEGWGELLKMQHVQGTNTRINVSQVGRDQLVKSHTIPESRPTLTLATNVASFLPRNDQVSD